MTSPLDRRGFLVSLPALMMAPRVIAQTANAPIKLRSFNHVNLNPPTSTVGSAGFGTITSALPGRNVQLGLKFYW